MASKDELPILVSVHGLRNQVAEFAGGEATLLVGGMTERSYAGPEESLLLTVEGRDSKTGKIVDIEIALQLGQARELVSRIIDRMRMGN